MEPLTATSARSWTTTADDTLLEPSSVTTLENRRILDLRQGLLYRRTVFLDERNRRFLLSSLRFISLADPHLIAIRCFFCSLGADATIHVEDAIDAGVTNRDTVEGYGGHVFWDTEIFVLPFFTFTDSRVERCSNSFRQAVRSRAAIWWTAATIAIRIVLE